MTRSETLPKTETGNPAPAEAGKKERRAHIPGGTAYWKPCLAVVVGVVLFDHLTKWLTIVYLGYERPQVQPVVDIVPGLFRLLYEENRGAAFSILDGNVTLLAFVSVAVSAWMTWLWTKLPADEIIGRLAFAVVVGGAVGNLIDRACRKFVVDMFDAYIGRHHWPVFNVADSFICIGMTLIVIRMLKGRI